MADFNQSPLGQTAVDAGISNFDVTIGATTVTVSSGASLSSVKGTSGSLSLTQVESGTFDMYPSYRRPIRLIASTPAT
jgi:hypothetical protein